MKVPTHQLSPSVTSVALLALSTSRQRAWKSAADSYVLTHLLPSLLATAESNFKYTVFVGIDHDDAVLASMANQTRTVEGIDIVWIALHQPKGHVTKMWNCLFKVAFARGFEYFFQCGDDLVLLDPGWTSAAVAALKLNDGIGMTSPIDPATAHRQLLTQSIVSREHMHIFGWYFPEEITNWFCDNWINSVYEPHYKIALPHRLTNQGGYPRYDIVRAQELCATLVARDKLKLQQYLNERWPH